MSSWDAPKLHRPIRREVLKNLKGIMTSIEIHRMQAGIFAVLLGALLVAGYQTRASATHSSSTQRLHDDAVSAMITRCSALQKDACSMAKGCSWCRSKWGQGKYFDDGAVSTLPQGTAHIV